jgi:hypothetical protein
VRGGFVLVDRDGVALRRTTRRPAGIPLLALGRAVRAAAAVVAEMPVRLKRLLVAVSAAESDAVTLHLSGDLTVVWGSAGQAGVKSAEIAALLRTGARYIDVSDPATAVSSG